MKNLTPVILLFLTLSSTLKAQVQDNKQHQLLQKAVERYEKLNNKDTWTVISLGDKTALKVNDQSPAVKVIKERLELMGDMRKSNSIFGDLRRAGAEVYTPTIVAAVKRFQLRHGLADDGIIGPTVVKALNTPLEARIKQLQINMERLSTETQQSTGKRIVANIPEYKLHVYEGNQEVLSMDIVVGKTTDQTVIFSDEMKHVVFSPYWNVPPSIIKNEILPAMKRNSRYLQNENMEITGNEDGLPVIRQKPGAKNSLGKVKFMFPNKYNIYFHDTPSKTLFTRTSRAFSHGCIRLSQPFELAKYLLKDQSGWTDEAIQRAMNAGSEKWVALDKPVPVVISYNTAWVDSEGTVHFRDDIYGHDKKEMARLVE
ncbi:MAG TPA: L,D-transpeptidase family protein [Sphingobacteriaceae bacterium]|nr:L,D-transpeptidase family protein [Sphingobacteriaceae bacterium]